MSGTILKLRRAMCLAVCLTFLSGCSDRKPSPAVLARVGDKAILVQDLRAEAERRQRAGQALPDKETLLRDMIAFEAMVQRARRDGLEKDPVVRRELDKTLIVKMQERDLLPRLDKIEVTEQDVKAEYEKNMAKYLQPKSVRLAGLVLDLPVGASDAKRTETRARLTEARQRVMKDPAPGGRGPAAQGFGALALEYTDDPTSRHRGGDLGWLRDGAQLSRWPTNVIETGFALKKGEASEIIEADGGCYLVMKTDERPEMLTPIENVRATLQQSLRVRKEQELRAAYVEDAIRLANAEIDANALAAVDLPKDTTKKTRDVTFGPSGSPNVN